MPKAIHRRAYSGVAEGAYELLLAELDNRKVAVAAGERSDGGLHRFGSPPRDIILHFESEALQVMFERVEWHGPHTPEVVCKVWRSAAIQGLDEPGFRSLVTAARRARRRQYSTCRYCRRIVGPGHGKGVCQGCASARFGVVY